MNRTNGKKPIGFGCALFLFMFLTAGTVSAASHHSKASKPKDDSGWTISDEDEDDGVSGEDNNEEAPSKFKKDADDTYEDDPDIPGPQTGWDQDENEPDEDSTDETGDEKF